MLLQTPQVNVTDVNIYVQMVYVNLYSHAPVCEYQHYNIKLSVNKITILIEIIIITIIMDKNEKYKATFHLFICLCGVFMVSQQCLVGPFGSYALEMKRIRCCFFCVSVRMNK